MITAKKIRMTQIFQEDGTVVPATLLFLKKHNFKIGDEIKISGKSKGKGFQGVVKRWGFKGAASKTHGTKHTERAPGSIGSAFPQKVFKGKKMAGRMGNKKVTLQKMQIVKADKNQIAIKGAVPGRKGTLLEIHES